MSYEQEICTLSCSKMTDQIGRVQIFDSLKMSFSGTELTACYRLRDRQTDRYKRVTSYSVSVSMRVWVCVRAHVCTCTHFHINYCITQTLTVCIWLTHMHKLKNALYVHYHERTASQKFQFTRMLLKRSNLDYSHMTKCGTVSIKIVIASLHKAQTLCNQKHSGVKEMHPFNTEQ